MADFKTHLAASSIVGVGYGGAACALGGMPLPSCVLAAGLCGASGMLPDIDSGPGRPLREITSFLAVAVPAMLFGRLQHYGLSQSSIILVGVAVYLTIRFGLAELLRRYTVHRGMFHSFVAAAIFGELTYLLLYDDSHAVRWLIAGGVVLGFLSHLCLDEIYSVQWDGRPRIKKSFGTALKVFAHGWWPNVSAYAKFAILTYLVVSEPGVVEKVQNGQAAEVVENLEQELKTRLPATVSLPRGIRMPGLSPATRQAEPAPATSVAPPPAVAQGNGPNAAEQVSLPQAHVATAERQQPAGTNASLQPVASQPDAEAADRRWQPPTSLDGGVQR
ncbi:MAG: metal-dependent hydrolase [Pirellulales bacterium]|nr:metal-dependent hydrolase [Pirellulales bacterium]